MATICNVNYFSFRLKYNTDVTVIIPEEVNIDSYDNIKAKTEKIYINNGKNVDEIKYKTHIIITIDSVSPKEIIYKSNVLELADKYKRVIIIPHLSYKDFENMNISDRFEKYVEKEIPQNLKNMFRCIDTEDKNNYISKVTIQGVDDWDKINELIYGRIRWEK